MKGWRALHAPQLRLRAMWRIGARALDGFWAADGDAMAGYVAYSVFLSMFPFAIFAAALTSQFFDLTDYERLVDALFSIAPRHVAQTIEPELRAVVEQRGASLVTLSAVFAFYIASNAVESIRVAFDRAYRAARLRGFFARKARALIFVLLANVTFALLALLIIAAPLALDLMERALHVRSPIGLGVIRYFIGLSVFSLFLFELHLLLPSSRPPRRRLWPGIFVSVALWALAATGFSAYLASAPSYSLTYGAFAGVIVTLLFFYITAAAIIFGANVNAVLMTLRRPTRADSE